MSKTKNNAFTALSYLATSAIWFVQHKPVFGVLFVGLGAVFTVLSISAATKQEKQEKEERKM